MVLVTENAIFSPTIGAKREIKFKGDFDEIYSHLQIGDRILFNLLNTKSKVSSLQILEGSSI